MLVYHTVLSLTWRAIWYEMIMVPRAGGSSTDEFQLKRWLRTKTRNTNQIDYYTILRGFWLV